jgi:hypothetical protein
VNKSVYLFIFLHTHISINNRINSKKLKDEAHDPISPRNITSFSLNGEC